MRFTLCLFVIWLVGQAYIYGAKSTSPNTGPAHCLQSGLVGAPVDSDSSRDASNVPALHPVYVRPEAQATPAVPPGTRWVLGTGQALDAVNDSGVPKTVTAVY